MRDQDGSPRKGTPLASKAAGTLGWIIIGIVALAWCAPHDKGHDNARPSTSPASAPQPLLAQPPRNTDSPAPRLEPAPPPKASLPAAAVELYATTNLNIRSASSTSAAVLGQVPKGAFVRSLEQQGAWHRVVYGGQTGWAHGDYLNPSPPTAPESERPLRATPPLPAAPTARAFSGRPVRAPYVGTCDCPYDLKRNGARCGDSSAYSRPGGREPECYE